ncbi:hypothetical protein G8759_22015 [Spirosoma aureum]|uniref:Outer membrane beta-barrel protein n=1 Tax=Spirosoma aureum TaxID=2692134 RepID=A0A6G9ARZ6_9BACT|nr:hypothetical protein [Spirosoma aureum]QIP15106.1 hypothetical protein G8759_22015 [Spirosoma aureum]
MKNIFLILSLLGITSLLRAQQTTQNQELTTRQSVGHWVVELETDNLFLLKNMVGIDDYFLRKIIPGVGYLATKNLWVGIAVPIGWAPQKGTYYSDGIATQAGVYTTAISPKQIGIAPYVQQFFGKGKIKPYVGASYRYTYQQLDLSIRDLSIYLSQTGHESELSVFAGLTYSITPRFGIYGKLRYGWQSGNHPYITFPNRSESGYSTAFGYNSQTASANLGIRFVIGE